MQQSRSIQPAPSEQKRVPHALAALALCTLCMLAFCAAPPAAHARFNEASTDYPASQDLGEVGDIIYPQDIPEGQVFRVEARTTSRMCIMYESADDCANRTNQEQCLIKREGNTLLVVFYLSQAYTHIFMGTADEAVKWTNADGTDATNYIVGNPDAGYVPHYFSMSIPALNYIMDMSTYSGGSNGRELWYTRQVVFKPTRELLDAIEAAKVQYCTVTFTDGFGGVLSTQSVERGAGATAPGDPVLEGYTFTGWDSAFDVVDGDLVVNATWQENAPSSGSDENTNNGDNNTNNGDNNTNNGENTNNGQGSSGPDNGNDSGENTGPASSSSDSNSNQNAPGSPAAAAAPGSNAQAAGGNTAAPPGTAGAASSSSSQGQPDQGSSSSEAPGTEEGQEDGSDSSSGSESGGGAEPLKGIRLTYAGFDFPDEEEGVKELVMLDDQTAAGLTPMQLLGALSVIVLAGGILWRAGTFALGVDSPAKQPSAAPTA